MPWVDLANAHSLLTLLPISLVDLTRASSSEFQLRHGRAGESYVFNNAGQTLDLTDLLLLSALPEDVPCANAVKDSMRTKLAPEAKDVLVIIYAPASLAALAASCAEEMATEFRTLGGASVAHGVVVDTPTGYQP